MGGTPSLHSAVCPAGYTNKGEYHLSFIENINNDLRGTRVGHNTNYIYTYGRVS